ncbi:MAG: type III pantothenate kinase [bacterium]|nr:type III pantothenate kinase [Candidatus Thioglobus pontius]
MSHLYIDIGNTAVKWLFDGEYHQVLTADFSLALLPKAQQVWVSCVGDKQLLNGLDEAIFVKSQAEFSNFRSAYKAPENLGVDRFLAMISAIEQLPNQTLLMIDAGSALTFDLVLKSGEHQGGLIMPGLGVLRRSFTQFESHSKNLTLALLANNTEDAWAFGTANMLMGAINTQIDKHLQQQGDLKIILTGGDAKMIAYRLAYSVEIKENLVLDGLALYAQSCN